MPREKGELERRSYNFEIRAEEQEGTGILTGRPIVYNSRTDLGWFDEIIDLGALDGADLTDVRFLVNHDLSKIPLARSRRNLRLPVSSLTSSSLYSSHSLLLRLILRKRS